MPQIQNQLRPLCHILLLSLALLTLAFPSLLKAEPKEEAAVAPQLPPFVTLQIPQQGEQTRFTPMPSSETGVTFANMIDPEHPLRRLYVTGYAGGGVAIGDLNGDKRPDIFLVSGPGNNKLYLQTKPLTFLEQSSAAGVTGGTAWGTGAALADIDNDNDLDIFVCNYQSPAQLFINNGKGVFSERAKEYGIDFSDACMMPSFADIDRDGFLDLFLLNNRLINPDGKPKKNFATMRNGVPQLIPPYDTYYEIVEMEAGTYVVTDTGRPDRLFRHNGSATTPTYRDVTEESGLADSGMGLSATWWDYNRDGYPDLYVANDFAAPDSLWHNNGDGTFTDKLLDSVPHTTWFSMGADSADINNDGNWDLLVADMAATSHFKEKLAMGSMSPARFRQVAGPPPQIMRNALLIGTGTVRFLEAAYLAGVATTDWTWTVKFADFDNDGLSDLFFTNGSSRDYMNSDYIDQSMDLRGRTEWDVFADSEPRREKNLAYRGSGLKFEDVSARWGLDHNGMSYAAAHADLDRDGDLDLVVSNLDEEVSILRNDSNQGNRLLLELRGTESNRYAYGAEVSVSTESATQLAYLQPVRGFNASNEAVLHFGLGQDRIAKEIEIRWPSGKTQLLKELPAGRLYTVTEPTQNQTLPQSNKSLSTPQFRKSGQLMASHSEREFDDYLKQPLLPYKLSQLGPGLAWGDVDDDGDEDCFLAGASGQAGQIFLRQDDGSFLPDETEIFNADRESEDLGALFFDADSDGDSDLYVVSGGVEVDSTANVLVDRLYINDGHGNFRKAATDALPSTTHSGGSIAAADFDRDGDLDLFIAGRVVPGRYPSGPESFLLVNETTAVDTPKFSEATDALAPGLRNSGIATAALWTDVDRDGWIDLLVAHEWGPIALWKNIDGRFEDRTEFAGLAGFRGWWNGITGNDFDGDGDIDYVATNFGLNSKYKASTDKPTTLYYGAFSKDETGKNSAEPRIIEAKEIDGSLYPVRGRGCSTTAMPHLAEKFSTYKDFALASLDQIYPAEELSSAEKFQANYLKTSILINRGDGTFEVRPLSPLAQISPAFGVVATEVNGDGHPDIYLVQNFFHPQIETGRLDSGLSLLLEGRGDAHFTDIWPKESGLLVPGDAKSLTAVDLNNDARVDFVIGQNDSPLLAFVQQESKQNAVAVSLNGPAGNRWGVGAKVTLVRTDGHRQTSEVYAGSGYLSQSSAKLFFGLGQNGAIKKIEVQWPDGSRQTETECTGNTIVISKAGSE